MEVAGVSIWLPCVRTRSMFQHLNGPQTIIQTKITIKDAFCLGYCRRPEIHYILKAPDQFFRSLSFINYNLRTLPPQILKNIQTNVSRGSWIWNLVFQDTSRLCKKQKTSHFQNTSFPQAESHGSPALERGKSLKILPTINLHEKA